MKPISTFLITFIFITISCGSLKNKFEHNNEMELLTLVKVQNMFKTMYEMDGSPYSLCDIYVVDGIPFDKEEMDSLFQSLKKVEYVTFVKNTFSHKNCDNITVIKSTKQKYYEKKAVLETVRKIYLEELPKLDVIIRDFHYNKCPILIINDLPILDVYKSKSILDSLEANSIQSVYYFPRKLKQEFWGNRGEGGLVKIKTNTH